MKPAGADCMRGRGQPLKKLRRTGTHIVTSIPYQVNKAEMIKKTADLVNDKKIEGITDIRDESDRTGMRIVYELKRVLTNVVLNKLYQYTALQKLFQRQQYRTG